MSKITISTRLWISYCALLLIAAGASAFSYLRFVDIAAANEHTATVEWVKADAAATVALVTRSNAVLSMELTLAEGARRRAILEEIDSNKRRVGAALERLDALVESPQGKQRLQSLLLARRAYVSAFTQVAQSVARDDLDQAKAAMLHDVLPALARLQNEVDGLVDLQRKIAQTANAELGQRIDTARWLLVAAAAAALIVGVTCAWLVSRAILRPIEQAVQVADRIAAGELRVGTTSNGQDECAHLLQTMEDMRLRLLDIVGSVRGDADEVASACTQIAAGSTDLSSRSESQASALEQTAAAMEQLSATVGENAQAGAQACSLARNAADIATKGGQMVAQVVQKMDAINDTSRRIADITSLIDGIAFQTNILALNASVEAARAGEAGRGFAVVAGEVRSLAARSVQAAGEIRKLTTESTEGVRDGCTLVHQTGETMSAVVNHVHEVADLMDRLMQSTNEQNIGIAQVSEALAQLDEITQANASVAQQAAASAAALQSQSNHLQRSVSYFDISASTRLALG